MRLALVTTAPSLRSRVGDCTPRLLPHLARHVDCELFVAPGREGEQLCGRRTRSAGELRPREFDQVLFQVGNERHQAFMLPLLRAIGGTVALHDWVLLDLALGAHPALERPGVRGLLAALREGGVRQAVQWRSCRGDSRALERLQLPFNRSIVRFGDAYIVHTELVGRLVLADRNAPTPIAVVPRGADLSWRAEDRQLERARLGLEPTWREAFLVSSCGTPPQGERLLVLLEALALARRSRPDVRLVLIGSAEPGGPEARALVSRLGLDQAVRFAGHLSEDEGQLWIHAADLAVELQSPGRDDSRGGILHSLALGRGVVAAAADEHGELPDECVYKLHPGEGEALRLAQKLIDLRDAPAVRASMEQAAREFVAAECRWERVAELYAEALDGFPRPRAARRSLFTLRLRQALREGRERAAARASGRAQR